MGSVQQLKALLWKHFLIKRRSIHSILAELVFPAVLCVAIFTLRESDSSLFGANNEKKISRHQLERTGSIDYLLYTPASPAVEALLMSLNIQEYPRIRSFASTSEAKFFKANFYTDYEVVFYAEIPIAIVKFELDDFKEIGKTLRFKMLAAYDYHPSNVYSRPNYFWMDITHVRDMKLMYHITRCFINHWIKRLNMSEYKMPTLYVQEMPPRPKSEIGQLDIEYTILYPLMFIGILSFTASAIVQERESKAKESMKLMGLNESVYWLSWCISSFLSGLIVCVCAMLVMTRRYPKGYVWSSPASIVLTLELLFLLDTITAAFLLSCLINKGRNASIIAIILYLILENSASPLIAWVVDQRLMLYLVGTVTYGLGFFLAIDVVFQKEVKGYTLDWDNIHRNYQQPSQTFQDGLVLIALNILFNLFCCWYVTNICPGEYGIRRPFYFFLMFSYWFPSSKNDDEPPEISPDNPEFFETPPAELNPGIKVRNLVKMFGKHVAVAGTNLDLYEGQITALLGHNGAGKTTTINMITGFIPATSGTVIIQGLDLVKNTEAARKCIGLCPQHDVLFQKLTCREHLLFVLKLKGQMTRHNENEIDELLDTIKLWDKRKSYPTQISGGQKRKLSLACAFIGGTKVIFLDEPSTGLDPAARQEMWAFLKKMREGRTILLTTHYMDEADVLGDRIAIMAEGRVKCCGTPMFLKRVYGTGYGLRVVKDKNCQTELVTAEVLKHIPEARYVAETNLEVDYALPDKLEEKYPALLKALEDDAQQLQISGFGLSATTLEDVFIKVGSELPDITTDANPQTNPQEMLVPTETNEVSESDLIYQKFMEGRSRNRLELFSQQLRGTFVKKWLLFQRNIFLSLNMLVLPSLLVLIGLQADFRRTGSGHTNMPPLSFNFDLFCDIVIPLRTTEGKNNPLVDAIKHQSPSTEFLEIQTGNLSEFCLAWYRAHTAEDYDNRMLLGLDFTRKEPTLFYQELLYAQFMGIQMLMNAHVKTALGPDFSVEAGLEYDENTNDVMRGKVHEFLTLMCISLAMALIPVGFIYVLLSERACGAKHLQALSGVHPFAYWFATFAFDYIFYLLVSGAMLGVLSYKSEDFIKGDRWRLTLMMFAVFGLAIFPYLYALQNFFQNPAYGITVLLIMNIIIGMILGSVNGATKLSNQNLTALWQMVDDVGVVISPNYILSGALISMIKGDQNIRINFQTRAELAKHNQFDYLFHRDDDYLRDGMQQLLILTAISWLVVAFIDYKLYRLILYKLECLNVKVESDSYRYKEDEDVAKERKRITETNEHKLFKTDAMVMVGVSKRYCSSKTVAVVSTNLGVQEKECLGLLGQNGAGKTTMFKMLTGDIALSNGDAYFKGDSIKTKLKTVQSMMSYCPQFDALHDVLTGRETLYLYGRLRGVRDSCLKEVTNIVIDFVNLRPHEDKCTKTYSGGNKKKLSVGISIIGDPQFIMLDEPTAGMDPVSRRILWKCLHTIRSMTKTLVLTSHSMEECEALCTKIAIFKKGRMLCLGSPQHLKNKYGQGYSVVLHISEQEDGTLHPLEPAVNFVSQALGDVKVFNTQPAYCHLQVPESTLLSTLFQVLIEAKSTFFLKHFTVHQQSLEQVFLLLMKEEE